MNIEPFSPKRKLLLKKTGLFLRPYFYPLLKVRNRTKPLFILKAFRNRLKFYIFLFLKEIQLI